ncbi:GNAT family N-acetyltransferase [Jejudonia soesokkakensis]|uniref:GNAT family N-acetyltransferase n=1 Tax=Jejudonia soesokkakensis TaxID=1323432 RepID=A0ABW2MST4_9FLAO
MMIEPLHWDSTFFDIRVGKIASSKEAFQIPEEIPFDLLYLESKNEFVPTLKNFTSTLTQAKVLFEKQLVTPTNEVKAIYSFSELDIPIQSLYPLAYESGAFSRFKLDPNFSRKQFKRLYKAWVAASCTGTFAHDVLMYLIEEKAAGFVAYSISEKNGTIGLIGVHPEYQGKGIGSNLLQAVENELVQLGCSTLSIPTQVSNKKACSFYKKMGYSEKEITFITHYWRQ